MKAIIGAGPAGLYTALKLHQAGIKDIVIYDSHAGNYTRPGHLNENAFRKAEKSLNIPFWKGEFGHIKDFERNLYVEVLKAGIRVEKKDFVSIQKDKNPGVMLKDTAGKEEFVAADYVFDCSGSRRQVVHAVNQLYSVPPFKLEAVTEPPISNHFLAYIKIEEDQVKFINLACELDLDNLEFLQNSNSLDFSRALIKLRALGWNEFTFPRCYGKYFGKDKGCLYLQAPPNLAKEEYDNWVQTVLECYIKPISYQHLKAPRKYSSKPRFTAFTVTANALQQVSYKGENLPTVIALGDTQIDPNYFLAHGIYNGMSRIDALFKTMEIIDGKIYYFDANDYLAEITKLLRNHKEALIKQAQQEQKMLIMALDKAALHLKTAIINTSIPMEANVFTGILQEVEARISYVEARQELTECHKTQFTNDSLTPLLLKLEKVHTKLMHAANELPSYGPKIKDAQSELAVNWKNIGNELYKRKRFLGAIDAYKKSMEIYSSVFQGTRTLEELPIYSNLVIVYNQAKLYSQAIITAKTALQLYDNGMATPKPVAIHEKLVFNLVKALYAQAQESLLNNPRITEGLYTEIGELGVRHQSILGEENRLEVRNMIDTLKAQIPKKTGEALQSWGIFPVDKTDKKPNDANGNIQIATL